MEQLTQGRERVLFQNDKALTQKLNGFSFVLHYALQQIFNMARAHLLGKRYHFRSGGACRRLQKIVYCLGIRTPIILRTRKRHTIQGGTYLSQCHFHTMLLTKRAVLKYGNLYVYILSI